MTLGFNTRYRSGFPVAACNMSEMSEDLKDKLQRLIEQRKYNEREIEKARARKDYEMLAMHNEEERKIAKEIEQVSTVIENSERSDQQS
jgi:hypothetical protein